MVTNQDQFSFNPENHLVFNKKLQFSTIPGGVMSITLGIIFTFAWYQQLYLMTNYLANNVMSSLTATDFEEIGVVKLKTMKAIPFYSFYYKNKEVMRHDPVMCKEFGGDCNQFVNKYIKIVWVNGKYEVAGGPWLTQNYQGHVCEPDEITKRHYATGKLFVCSPSETMELEYNYES